MSLEAITIPPASGHPPKGLIVVLHGWGANAQDVLGLAPYMNLPDYQYVFADAPFPHPQVPGGRMWYDFPADFQFQSTPAFRDRPDLSSSRQFLTEFLQAQANQTGISLNKTILGGFSQGGAMTLDVGLVLPLAGLMVLSGYLHAPPQPQTSPPMLMVHGRQDRVVPLTAAHAARESLQSLGIDVRYQEYDMGHEIQPIVLSQMQTFVEEIFSNM